jgi:hypothetical protein
MEVALALRAGVDATVQPDRVRVAPGEHRRVRVLVAVRADGERPVEAELAAVAGGARSARRVTIVPPQGSGR